jgi:uncharacterized membrane protein YoaK (UPF0700 family)
MSRIGFLGRDGMVLVLTWAAGGVDAISYLGLGRVFTANMTGNAVLLGLAIGQGHGLAALRSIVALVGFVLGVAVGAIIVERGPAQGDWPKAVSRAVAVECIILVFFAIAWHLPHPIQGEQSLYALITLSAVAMGIQSAAIRHLNVPGIATTYITGTLTSMVSGFVYWLYAGGIYSSEQRATASVQRKHGVRLQGAVFVVYVLAAAASALLQTRNSWLVTTLPLTAVAFVVVNAFLRERARSAAFN